MVEKLKLAVTPWTLRNGSTSMDSWTAQSLCQQAEIAESLGFHSFWLPESHFGDNRSIPSPLTLLAAVAARTKTLKLGSTSYLLTIRNPLQAAEEVAVLDQLSEGRVILGVGRGVQEAMFKAYGLPVKEKRSQFKKNLDIMLAAFRGEAIARQDDGSPIYLAPTTLQKPHPPIWLAAFGPLALKQAGLLGMPYLASPMESLDVLAENYQRHQDVATQAGFEKIKTIPVMRTIFVTDSQNRARSIKQALIDAGQNRMQDQASNIDTWTLIGSESYVKEKLHEYQSRLGLTHLIARGRLPSVTDDEQVQSHEKLLKLCDAL